MARPKRTYKRAGERTNPNVKVHEETWRAFQVWCSKRRIIPSDLIEDYMAATVTEDRPLTEPEPTSTS
jgi:hypothetical protein